MIGTAILLYVNCTGAVIGPNVIQSGTPLGFTGGTPAQLTYTYAPTPMWGAVNFAASTAQTVTFATPLPLATYVPAITPVATSTPPNWWISAQGLDGFTINFATPYTGNVYWSIRIG